MTDFSKNYSFQFKSSKTLTKSQIRHQIMFDIVGEIYRARHKYPTNKLMMGALCEEAGELARAMGGHTRGDKKNQDVKNIYMEAIQTAAVAIRILEEGSSDYEFQGLMHEYGPVELEGQVR